MGGWVGGWVEKPQTSASSGCAAAALSCVSGPGSLHYQQRAQSRRCPRSANHEAQTGRISSLKTSWSKWRPAIAFPKT